MSSFDQLRVREPIFQSGVLDTQELRHDSIAFAANIPQSRSFQNSSHDECKAPCVYGMWAVKLRGIEVSGKAAPSSLEKLGTKEFAIS
jgi:hypothetical protein